MLTGIKKFLYFPLANYFKFFAKIRLWRWHPRVIVITGSIGKTTLFELIKAQIPSENAYFAEHVNSAFGITANILGLEIKNPSLSTWVSLFFKAPFAVFSKSPRQEIYITEADCDRVGEGKFLADLLKPEVTIWTSSTITHSANFDSLKKDPEQAIGYEYGYFVRKTSKLVIANIDFKAIENNLSETKAEVIKVAKDKYLKSFKVNESGTVFEIEDEKFSFPSILPEESYFSIVSCQKLVQYLDLPFDSSFKTFDMPAGRGTLLKGINNSTIIDSSYNASTEAVVYFLDILRQLKKGGQKAVFLMGDMRELGNESEEEHKKIAQIVNKTVNLLVCVGPLTKNYVIPNIKDSTESFWFANSKQAGEFLEKNLPEKSILLVKGSQNELFLEESIKILLKDKEDSKLLCRQNEYWKRLKNAFFESQKPI